MFLHDGSDTRICISAAVAQMVLVIDPLLDLKLLNVTYAHEIIRKVLHDKSIQGREDWFRCF